MQRSNRLALQLMDYQRIFQVARGIIREVGRDVSRSYLFFNMVGAHLVGTNYKIAARPVTPCCEASFSTRRMCWSKA